VAVRRAGWPVGRPGTGSPERHTGLTGATHARPSVTCVTFLRLRQAPWRVLSSQEHARRNALVASTALTARRLERLAVEEFLAEHAAASPEARRPAHSA
jgi:hypothetical protein